MSVVASTNYLQCFVDRRQCFAELLQLSREQHQLIDTDDYTTLLVVLGNKQRVIGRLEEIARMNPYLGADWQTHRDRLPPTMRKGCEQVLAETEGILVDLMEEERQCTQFLTHRREETRLQLQGISAGQNAQSAYRDSLAPVTHRTLDVDR